MLDHTEVPPGVMRQLHLLQRSIHHGPYASPVARLCAMEPDDAFTLDPDYLVILGFDLSSGPDLHAEVVYNPDTGNSSVRAAFLHSDGRRHDPLRGGEDQAAGDRRARNAGTLPVGPGVRAGRSVEGEGQPGSLAAPIADHDPPYRPRSLRPHAGAGQRGRNRPVLLASALWLRDLRRQVGQRPAPREELPGKLTASQAADRFVLISLCALSAMMVVGVALAIAGGRL